VHVSLPFFGASIRRLLWVQACWDSRERPPWSRLLPWESDILPGRVRRRRLQVGLVRLAAVPRVKSITSEREARKMSKDGEGL
jgi:hypothetical protein